MLGPLTILIADHDTQLYKEHYASIDWTALGFEIKGVCKTGEAALTSAEINQPDFVILNCHLPGQTSRPLVETLLKISPSTRILLLCELSDIEEFNTCFFKTESRNISSSANCPNNRINSIIFPIFQYQG